MRDTVAYSAEQVLTQKDFGQFTAEEMQKAQEVIAKLGSTVGNKTESSEEDQHQREDN